VERIDAHKALGFIVNPVLPEPVAVPGESITVRVEIYNTTNHEISVPDPAKLLLTFENVGTNEPMIQMEPFALDGPLPGPPKRELSLKPWAVISAPLTFDVPPESSGLFLIREYYYGTISAALRVQSKALKKDGPNQSADSTAKVGTSAAEQPRVPASSASHL